MGRASKRKKNQEILHSNNNSEPSTPLPKTELLHKPIIHFLTIIAFGVLAYSNTFQVPFLFDDIANIVENPIIKDFRYFRYPADVLDVPFYAPFYEFFKSRFVGYLTFALNYKLNGLNVTGYHIINLLIHIANALLVYALIKFSFRTPHLRERSFKRYSSSIALLSALFFVAHPVQTQAVTYIVQRLASLATMFYLLSLVSYIRSRLSVSPTERYSFYAVSIISAVLAMKTKETSFTLPVTITLYEVLFFTGKKIKRGMYLVPILLTMLIIPLSLMGISKSLGDAIGDVGEIARVQTPMSRWDYLFTEFRVIVTYIRLLFLPINQNVDYDYPIYHSFFEPGVFFSFLFSLSILSAGLYLFYRVKRKDRESDYPLELISFGLLWFFITLSVESSIIPIIDVIFEHRLYLPSVGMFVAVTTSLFIAKNRLEGGKLHFEKAIMPTCILILIILTGATYSRNMIWQDRKTLWEDIVKKAPSNARAHVNLGFAYSSEGLTDQAIEQYQIAIRLRPDYAEAHNNLGNAYRSNGLIEEAVGQYLIALNLQPDYADVHFNLGNIYFNKALFDKAIEHYEIAVQLNPNDSEALHRLWSAKLRKKQAENRRGKG